MIDEETRKRLDAMLRHYPEMGRRKRERVLDLMSGYIPQGTMERMLDRNRMPEWVVWASMSEEQRSQGRKIVAREHDRERFTAFWFHDYRFKVMPTGVVEEAKRVPC